MNNSGLTTLSLRSPQEREFGDRRAVTRAYFPHFIDERALYPRTGNSEAQGAGVGWPSVAGRGVQARAKLPRDGLRALVLLFVSIRAPEFFSQPVRKYD